MTRFRFVISLSIFFLLSMAQWPASYGFLGRAI